MPQDKENNKLFAQTKRLIRIALEDGWTQAAIAKKARVQQSVVSGWSKGASKAKYQQIEFLLEEYGDRLRKQSTTVYSTQKYHYKLTSELKAFMESHDIDPSPFQVEGLVDEGALRELLENSGSETQEGLREKYQAAHSEDITQVEAPIIFRFVFQREFIVGRQKKKQTVEKWILHSLGGGRFLLVTQARRELSDQQLEVENKRRQRLSEARYKVPSMDRESRYIQTCNDDAAHWNSRLLRFSELGQMLERVEGLLSEMHSYPLYSQYDFVAMPFLLKKALLNAGFPVKGVSKITAY
ncbi:helix-turn-helix domain-containing protein [Endozoicomonas ascidiicola]|uniref:helix-turn-helix domain-containing protein n=1 Tax=Endozoicomonas ascidiicola TaxID=1698521 RepID=UPI0008321CA1|nr:helix-turn-helix transcriptional regulator [Endozoicomonas ascidiicola]